MNSLLPLNSTQLERAVEYATDEVTEVPLRTLYNPDACPAHLLHQLAWAWSVDRWDDKWSDAVKRSVIRSAFFVHAHKGTIGALRRVVEPLGYLITITEWWQRVPMGAPATFSLEVGVLDSGITDEMYQELTALIDDAKPVTRHLIELAISLESTGALAFAGMVEEGEDIDVFPPVARDIEVAGRLRLVMQTDEFETLDINP